MAKIVSLLFLLSFILYAEKPTVGTQLEQQCFNCHDAQNIPSEMIYRRYLLKYSSKETIKKQMFSYLKAPLVKNSIMPPQFFSKFPKKQAMQMDDKRLNIMIDQYIAYFDIKPKIKIIPKKSRQLLSQE